MPSITPAQIRHIAKLARLCLSDKETEMYVKELGSILAYVDLLKEVDTKGVEPTAQVTGLTSVLREDTLGSSKTLPDALLSCSPLRLVQHQIETPTAHG